MKIKLLTSQNPKELIKQYNEFQDSGVFINPHSLKIESHSLTSFGKIDNYLVLSIHYEDSRDNEPHVDCDCQNDEVVNNLIAKTKKSIALELSTAMNKK